MNLFQIFKNLFFPINCVFCNLENFAICEKCFSEIETEINLTENHLGIYSYHNDKIRKVMKDIKYNSNIELINPFAKQMALEFDKMLLISESFYEQIVIIPIPLSKKDSRMYNHAEELAKEFRKNLKKIFEKQGKKVEIVLSNLLIKNNKIKQAHAKNKNERLDNLIGKFLINEKELHKLKNKIKTNNLLYVIIDDVKTTGATFINAEKVLTENFASQNFPSSFILHLTLAH
jgi:predicted amidophosphoribosyltransferase